MTIFQGELRYFTILKIAEGKDRWVSWSNHPLWHWTCRVFGIMTCDRQVNSQREETCKFVCNFLAICRRETRYISCSSSVHHSTWIAQSLKIYIFVLISRALSRPLLLFTCFTFWELLLSTVLLLCLAKASHVSYQEDPTNHFHFRLPTGGWSCWNPGILGANVDTCQTTCTKFPMEASPAWTVSLFSFNIEDDDIIWRNSR